MVDEQLASLQYDHCMSVPYFRDGVNSLRAISLIFLVISELALSATLNIMTASYH
jgi:hypothetical protein